MHYRDFVPISVRSGYPFFSSCIAGPGAGEVCFAWVSRCGGECVLGKALTRASQCGFDAAGPCRRSRATS